MASFTTRIELVGVQAHSESEYAALHKAMGDQNFFRTITSDDQKKYKLPNAEYNISGPYDRSEVLNRAKKALAAINKSGRILVSESVARTWSNLEIAE